MREVKPRPVSGPARPGVAEAARRTGVSVHTLRFYDASA